jgi:acyl-coenzyme A thioesterase PaaI-like protein
VERGPAGTINRRPPTEPATTRTDITVVGSESVASDPMADAPDSWPTSMGLAWSVEPPGLVATFTPRPEHRGPPGYLHGGLAATCLDETMASLSIALDDHYTVTATLHLRYRKAIPIDGSVVRVEAWRDRPEARRTHKVQGRLLLADGSVAVEATGLFVRHR